MSSTTNIEWTDATWNPIRGCSRVSEGCRNCYAEKVAYRFSGPGQPYEGLAAKVNGHASWTGEVRLIEEHLLDPLTDPDMRGPVKLHSEACRITYVELANYYHGCDCPKRQRRIFVNSMSDLFHENVPDEWIDRIFAVMALCPQHTFQILTKRPARMMKYFAEIDARAQAIGVAAGNMLDGEWIWHAGKKHRSAIEEIVALSLGLQMDGESQAERDLLPLPNVWLGVSVENQATAEVRIPLLLQTPAAVRFISAEPLLGPVDLEDIVIRQPGSEWHFSCLGDDGNVEDDEDFHGACLDWVIVGGESGPGARPMHPDWARSLRDQCQAAGVPFFFKQWGEWLPVEPYPNGCVWASGEAIVNSYNGDIRGYESLADDSTWLMRKVGKKAAGALLDGREWREFPEVPNGR